VSDAIRSTVRASLVDGLRVRHALVTDHLDAILTAATVMREALDAGHKVLLCGNGGSAADAQHIAAELVGRFVVERRALPAIALTTDTSALTAIGNDYGYDVVFSRQVEALGNPGDVLVAITTSGKSPNVVSAITAARARGMKVIVLTGAKGAPLVAECDAGVAVPSTDTARIQECHITIGHLLCEAVDAAFAAPSRVAPRDGAGKEYALGDLVDLREQWRVRGRTVVWTNGVFDLLHVGHLTSLREARKFGDVLVVGVNADASVRANKGPDRPIFPAAERVEMLAALDLVDAITVFDDHTPERVLAAVKPDVHVKGADYAPPHGKPIPEAELVRSYGGRIEFVPLVPDRSSTSTLERLLASRRP
jgi:phosphoheptose isomerase